MGNAEKIKLLRETTGILQNPDKEFWNSPEFPAGVAKGILVELLGNAATEWLLRLLIANPGAYILWCEADSRILPSAIFQRGLEPHRVKFINCTDDLYQPLRIALESLHYPFVVAPTRMNDVTEFQRLHLLAGRSKSTIFLLAEKQFSQAWPISLQVEINFSENGFDYFIQRQKYGQHK